MTNTDQLKPVFSDAASAIEKNRDLWHFALLKKYTNDLFHLLEGLSTESFQFEADDERRRDMDAVDSLFTLGFVHEGKRSALEFHFCTENHRKGHTGGRTIDITHVTFENDTRNEFPLRNFDSSRQFGEARSDQLASMIASWLYEVVKPNVPVESFKGLLGELDKKTAAIAQENALMNTPAERIRRGAYNGGTSEEMRRYVM